MSEPTDPTQLRDRLVAALGEVRLNLGPNALAMIGRGETIRLSGNEKDAIAEVALGVVQAEVDRLTAERDAALGAVERTVQMMHDYNTSASQRGEVFAHVNCRQVINLLSLTWPDGNYEGASDAH